MDNRFHRYFKLQFEFIKPNEFNVFYDTIGHFAMDRNSDYSQPMIKWLNSRNVDSVDIECFYTSPNGGIIPPHTDGDDFNDQTKINITWGPLDGEVRWWKSDKWYKFVIPQDKTKDRTFKDISVLRANIKDCELIYSSTTNRPSLINVGQLQSTYNPGTVGRHTLCFNLIHLNKPGKIPVVWDQALEIFKDVLE